MRKLFNNTRNVGQNDRRPKINAFSPNPNLGSDQLPGLSTYISYLQTAFQEPRIRNIVIDGIYGIGKSSVIQAFETEHMKSFWRRWEPFDKIMECISNCLDNWRCTHWLSRLLKHRRAGFLYVSLGDYIKRNSADDGQWVTEDQENALERRLLLQIYARFHRNDLRLASFRLVQEQHPHFERLVALFSAVLFVSALTLLLYPTIDDSLKALFPSADKAQGVMYTYEKVASYENVIRLFLCVVILVISAVTIGAVVYYTVSKWHAKTATLKLDSFEASCELEACDGYLDQHTTEMIYCLEYIARKIDYTVVFEDIDRLETSSCLTIMSRLHEINHLVNLRLARKGKQLRFIYIVNSSIISQIQHEKFADYILSIIPRSNLTSAESVFRHNLLDADDSLRVEGTQLLRDDMEKIVSGAAPFLTDYRTQFAVLNDYGILLDLYCCNNLSARDSMNVKRSVLAFSIYKNLFPHDYSRLWQGQSCVLPSYDPQSLYVQSNGSKQLLEILAGGENPPLSASSLYFISYSRDEIISLFEQKLKSNWKETITNARETDMDFLRVAVRRCCADFALSLVRSNDDTEFRQTFQEALHYLISVEDDSNCIWLFAKDIPTKSVIELLSSFSNKELLAIYQHAGWDPNGSEFIYDRLKDSACGLRLMGREIEVCLVGVGTGYQSSDCLTKIDDNGIIVSHPHIKPLKVSGD